MVPTKFDDEVTVIDEATSTVITTIAVGDEPTGVIHHPGGALAYIANAGDSTISVINTSLNVVVDSIDLDPILTSSPGLAVHPDGTRLYSGVFSGLAIIDAASNEVLEVVTTGNNTRGVGILPSGDRVFVVNRTGGDMSVVDTGSNTVVDVVPLGGAGTFPSHLAVGVDGENVFVVDETDTLYVVDVALGSVVDTVAVGDSPSEVAVHPNGDTAYVLNRDSGDLSVVDLLTNSVSETITLGLVSPVGMTMHPLEEVLYIADLLGDSLLVLDTVTYTVVDTIAVGDGPTAVGEYLAVVPVVFKDGFESGDTAAWSTTVQ